VRDTGVGINDEELKTIFDPFNRSSNPLINKINNKGNGLGLHISKKIAKGLGGDLTVTSKLGLGS
jgi:signal transduction histidine kinase